MHAGSVPAELFSSLSPLCLRVSVPLSTSACVYNIKNLKITHQPCINLPVQIQGAFSSRGCETGVVCLISAALSCRPVPAGCWLSPQAFVLLEMLLLCGGVKGTEDLSWLLPSLTKTMTRGCDLNPMMPN